MSGREATIGAPAAFWRDWAPAVAGLAAMFIPTYWELARTLWPHDEQGHGPIILAVSLWLIWKEWPAIREARSEPALGSGGFLIFAGLLLYFVGRSQSILTVEVAAQIPMIAGTVLIIRGWKVLRLVWSPLFFMLFMIPLPGVFVQMVTIPLKSAVSYAAENILWQFNYPIARTGVILNIGQYQLLVADACAGLNSMFTLEALGLLYMNLMQHTNVTRNVLLAILIIPISFCANVIRVIVLVLVTYHFGDAAGQGFVHGFAGMVLFMAALILMLAVDSFLGLFLPAGNPPADAKARP